MSGRALRHCGSITVAAAVVIGLAITSAPAAHAAPSPINLLPKATGITFPAMAAVATTNADCVVAFSCPNLKLLGGETADPANYGQFISQVARFRTKKDAKQAMEYQWERAQKDIRVGLINNDFTDIRTRNGIQIIRVEGQNGLVPGLTIKAVYVRNGKKVVTAGGVQSSWGSDGTLSKLVKKAKLKAKKSFARVTISTPRPS